MTGQSTLPHILIIDDLFGGTVSDRANEDRANLCGQFLLQDVTGDEQGRSRGQKIKKPVAQAVFLRGQQPRCASIGDTVENDLTGTIEFIRRRWVEWRQDAPRWSMVLLDLCFYTGEVTTQSNSETAGMPEGRPQDETPEGYFGLQLLRAIHSEFPDLPVVILSSKPRDPVSLEYSTYGALGFLPRSDANSPELLEEYLRKHALLEDDSGEIIGRSKTLLLALRAARRAAVNEQNLHLLIRGERGVGKELLARYIHTQSAERRSRSFVIVNSANLTTDLYGSVLFGHKKGSFTNAFEDREGLIQTADGGDLFFDEIKDMVPQAQAGILRVLEEGTVAPIGVIKTEKVDVRFISATNADIESRSAAGAFRGDLLDRLRGGGTFVLPPLRDRKKDIPLLAERFVREAEQANAKALHRDIEPVVYEKLLDYEWPGNIRELRQRIFQAVNNNPDVEHLVPMHIEIPKRDPETKDGTTEATGHDTHRPTYPTGDRAVHGSGETITTVPTNLDEVISLISNYEFDTADSAALFDKLEDLEGAIARLLANYLKAALAVTKRPTREHPEGEIFIHPAVKLITGNSKITASKAADIIKRLLSRSRTVLNLSSQDALLQDALETARRLRPSKPKKKRGKG